MQERSEKIPGERRLQTTLRILLSPHPPQVKGGIKARIGTHEGWDPSAILWSFSKLFFPLPPAGLWRLSIPDSFQWRLRFQGISPFRTTNSISSKHGLTRATSPEPRHRTRGLALIKEARTAKQKPLLLTRRVYFSVDFFLTSKRKYPVASIIKRVNVMCFDYHGGWDTLATGTHAWLRVLTACFSWDCCFLSSYCITKSGKKPSLSLLVIELLHHSLRNMKSMSSCQIFVLPSTWIILLMLLTMYESFCMLISAVLFPTYIFLSFSSLLSYLLFLRLWQDKYSFLNFLLFPG